MPIDNATIGLLHEYKLISTYIMQIQGDEVITWPLVRSYILAMTAVDISRRGRPLRPPEQADVNINT